MNKKLLFLDLQKLFVRKKQIRRRRVGPLPTAQERARARAVVHDRLEYFNQHYNYTYHRVAIRSQQTRWGSCSSNGNLNFNYKIIFLPPEAQDYLIVHELVHLREFNHSRRFWDLVAETIPEYKRIGTTLRRGGYVSLR